MACASSAPCAQGYPLAFGDFAFGFSSYDRVGLSVLRDPYSQATGGLVRFHARRGCVASCGSCTAGAVVAVCSRVGGPSSTQERATARCR